MSCHIKDINKIHIAIGLIVLTILVLFLGSFMFDTFLKFAPEKIQEYAHLKDSEFFPSGFQTISELQKVPLGDLIFRVGGKFLFLFSLIAIVLMRNSPK